MQATRIHTWLPMCVCEPECVCWEAKARMDTTRLTYQSQKFAPAALSPSYPRTSTSIRTLILGNRSWSRVEFGRSILAVVVTGYVPCSFVVVSVAAAAAAAAVAALVALSIARINEWGGTHLHTPMDTLAHTHMSQRCPRVTSSTAKNIRFYLLTGIWGRTDY